MKNRDLLELAAQAVGFDTTHSMNIERLYCDPPIDALLVRKDGELVTTGWNPLRDNGDALKLASDLRLIVKPGKHKGDGCTVESQRDGIPGCTAFYDDPAHQMRYAIVRVAAEIGLKMP